jgi:hypothetical protein
MRAKTGEGCEFVKKGSVLLTAKPFAFILKAKFQGQRCDFCFKRSLKIIFICDFEFSKTKD